MKNLSQKFILLIFAIGIYSTGLIAQSAPVEIINRTACHVFIEYVEAHDCNTGTSCYAVPPGNCIPPFSTVVEPPCGGPTYEWASAGLAGAEPNCNPCSFLQTVDWNVPCYTTANTIVIPNCGGCGPIKARWISPTQLMIF
jgi:hypothetical protein